MYTCRECEKPVNQATEVCPYCGADLRQVEEAPAAPSSIAKRVGVWGVLIAAIWAFLWFILPERTTGVAARAESIAIEAVNAAKGELRSHHETHGTYPPNLDGLARSSYERIRDIAQRAQLEGYRLEYAPGPAAAGGNIQTFSLVARAGHYGRRNFFVNETGVVRWTKEDRAATAQDQPL